MRRSFVGALLLVAVVGGFVTYQHYDDVSHWLTGDAGSGQQNAGKKRLQTAAVRVAKAHKRTVPIILEGIGNVEARSSVAIKSRIDGQIMEANVKEGQAVKKGDLLFRLDSRPLNAQLRQAEANLSRDQANYDKAMSDTARFAGLAKKGYSPVTRLEDAQSSVNVLSAEIRASRAAVELAKLNMDYATIRAPIDGRVGSILLTPGNMVEANDTQPLLIINEMRPIYAQFSLPEKYIGELRAHLAAGHALHVEVRVQDEQASAEEGVLFFIDNAVDASTGTIKVKARFANENERLVPGQFVKARVTMDTLQNAIVVPSKAIQINQNGFYVWVVGKDNKVEARNIETGPESNAFTVITKGVKSGETVVTDGQLRLYPNAPVEPLDDNKKPDDSKVES